MWGEGEIVRVESCEGRRERERKKERERGRESDLMRNREVEREREREKDERELCVLFDTVYSTLVPHQR